MSSPSEPDREAELGRIRQDHADLAGKLVTARGARVYRGSDTDDLYFVEPHPVFRVLATDADLDRTREWGPESWWDPLYAAEPLNPADPRLAGCTSFYLFGVSRKVGDMNQTELGDIIAVTG